MNRNDSPVKELPLATGRPAIPLSRFAREIGRKPITLWRWRNRGMIKTVNICGRQYITPEEVERFNQRAAAGEFAREHKTPSPNGKHSAKRARTKKPRLAIAA